MKVISIWQPWASLVVHNHKFIETRSWPAPRSLLKQTIGIASTKSIKPEQRAHFDDEVFQSYYSQLGLPEKLEELPAGFLLGTAIFQSQEPVTRDECQTEEELKAPEESAAGKASRE